MKNTHLLIPEKCIQNTKEYTAQLKQKWVVNSYRDGFLKRQPTCLLFLSGYLHSGAKSTIPSLCEGPDLEHIGCAGFQIVYCGWRGLGPHCGVDSILLILHRDKKIILFYFIKKKLKSALWKSGSIIWVFDVLSLEKYVRYTYRECNYLSFVHGMNRLNVLSKWLHSVVISDETIKLFQYSLFISCGQN